MRNFPLTFSHLRASSTWKNIGIATLTGIAFLLICEPFLILDPALFFSDDDVRRLIPSMQVARGEIVHIWTLFDFSTTPFLFYLTHLLRDALGYPLECAALVGIAITIYKRATTGLILLSWLLPYFLLVGGLHTKTHSLYNPHASNAMSFGCLCLPHHWTMGTRALKNEMGHCITQSCYCDTNAHLRHHIYEHLP